MGILLWIILGQCVFAGAVVIILKKLLDKELMRAALEKLEYEKIPQDVNAITVRFSCRLHDEFKDHLESIRKRRFPQTNVIWQQDASLKGGVVIIAGEQLLDFSLDNRLKHFWS